MLHSGRHDGYRWLASHTNRDHLPGVLRSCPQLVLGKFVAITSFDSGPLTPSQEELRAGWSFDGRIMYSPTITDPSVIPHEQYDEWLIFSHETRQLPELQVFINFGGFTLAETDPDHHREHRERLWSQLAHVSAESYLAEGDYFLFASKNESAFECVEEAVKQLRRRLTSR
jgi:hypothetical protein